MNYMSIIYFVIIIAVFYFLMIRPERKRKKAAQDMRENLSVGDEITTLGGIVGKVVSVGDDFLVFETSEDRVRIQIAKWGVGNVGKQATQE